MKRLIWYIYLLPCSESSDWMATYQAVINSLIFLLTSSGKIKIISAPGKFNNQ